ncbi:MAG TPA: SDR family NAD(P)-dependent oxidoreductase [Myxococcota bacterium]|nr:SDR family NAD(P)-dependent oxidoreductase [Myxococcota bacterium]
MALTIDQRPPGADAEPMHDRETPRPSPVLTILVTGATDGIGLETARQLANQGHRLIIHGRSPNKLAQAQRLLAPLTEVAVVCADLGSLADTRRAVDELGSRFERIDTVLNNAGIYQNEPTLSVDGFELTFAVNHLAPFALTLGLLPLVPAGGRVINVSSVAHSRGRIDWSSLRTVARYDAYRAYAQSKLMNVMFTLDLQSRRPDLAVNSLHPGVVSTKLLTDGFGMQGPDSLAAGAATSVWLASAPETATLRGTYCAKSQVARYAAAADDAETRRRLWAFSCEAAGL